MVRMEVDADRPLQIIVYDREHPSQPRGDVIGTFQLNGDFRLEHLGWALLAEDNAEYPPNRYLERREWTSVWGGQSAAVDIIIEVMNNPYVAATIGWLASAGVSAATQRVMSRIRSEPITEEKAIHHARQLILQSGDLAADDLRVVGGGIYPRGARWVVLETPTARVRVGVALASKGGTSIATESWEARDIPPSS